MMETAQTQARAQGIGAQVTAADPSGSVWVSANAGTGKTRVLVDRISRLLLAGTAAGRILCLTFTKAAAAEMANRVNDRLGKWAAMNTDDLAADLAALFGRPATEDEAARAPRLFAETIEAPEGLRIRTIHSFCESLLGRFPLESGLAPHFSVIDERRAAELRETARDQVLSAAAAGDAALNAALDHLAGLVDEERFAAVMAELDSNRHRLHAMIARHGGLDALLTAGRRALGLDDDETRTDVLAAAAADGAFDAEALAAVAETLAAGSKTDAERGARLRNWLALDLSARAAIFLDDYAPAFLKADKEPRAESTLITKKSAAADPSALDVLLAEQARVYAVVQRLRAVTTMENTEALLVIATALLDAYERLKADRAMVDYDDLIGKAHDLLGAPGDVSWVHFKLDGGIDHILVDEAQDTSPRQWAVIEALAGDFFAGEGRDRGRTLFAVGDEKQSIYSFQGADPRQFGIVGGRVAAQAKAAEQVFNIVEMALSWRSTAPVLQAVDAVFAASEARDGLSWRDRPVRHLAERIGQAGLVELWSPMKPLPQDDDDPWDAPLDQVSAASPEVRLAQHIADTVDGWLRTGETLDSQGRPIEPGDVMVLVRSRGSFTEEMVRAFKERDIPVAGRDRMILADHLAVMDLIAAGRFALLPDDDLNTAVVLKGPFVEMAEDGLFDLAYNRKGSLWAELQKRRNEGPDFAAAHGVLAALLARADTMPPYEFFATLLADGGREALLAHLGAEAADPIDEFLGLTLDFERDHVPALEAFLHWVGQGGTEVKRDLEQSGGEVRVMTTHGAKGLQARIVFLADTCTLPAKQLADKVRWSGDADGDGDGVMLWPAFKENEAPFTEAIAEAGHSATEQEYRRLLYVAMTRAEDRLYVCGWKGERDLDDGCWHRLVETGLGELNGVERFDAAGDGDVMLRLAAAQTAAVAEPAESAKDETAPAPLDDWARRPPAPEPMPTQPLSPSRPDDEPPVRSPLAMDDSNRFQRGRLIHTLLQTLPDVPVERRRAAALGYLGLAAHELDGAAAEAICAETMAVIEHPDFAAIFGPGSRAEVPLVGTLTGGEEGPVVVSGQVDRLLVTEDEILVIDFKTNRPPPAAEQGVAPVYLRQMATYRALLRDIYPDRRVRAALLWTDEPRLMALSDAGLDAHAP